MSGDDPDLVPNGEPDPVAAGDDDVERAPDGEVMEPTSTGPSPMMPI